MVYEFGDFRLDTNLLELRGPTGPIAIEPKSLALLTFLVQERSRAVSKDEIFDAIWPGVFVTDASLSTAIKQARLAVGDDGATQAIIKTVRGHGFRFLAEVRETGPRLASSAPPPPPDRAQLLERSGRPTIAVRPFQLLGGDAGQQAIAEAIPAELIATLSRLRWLNVIARGSSFRFDARQSDHNEMGSRLNAHFIVSGLVEWMDAGISVFTELSDAQSGQVIWADRVNGRLQDVYEMRARIARDLAIALELRLPQHEADRLHHEPSESIDAWGHYHLGIRHMYRYDRADNEIAASHFRHALELDPKFARAFAGLSYTEFQNAFQHFGVDVGHHKNLTLAHAEAALKFDPLDPFCNLIYGRAKWLAGDAEDGLIWVDRAIELNPNYAFGFYNNATLNTALCNSDLADRNIETALQLSPLDPHLQSMYGTRALAAFIASDLEAATTYARRALKSPNPHLYVFIIGAAVHAQSGAHAEARACVDAIHAKQVPFGKSEFLTHFNLRNSDRRQELVRTLDTLGL